MSLVIWKICMRLPNTQVTTGSSRAMDIKTGKILLTGRIHNGLYQFDLLDTQSYIDASVSSATVHTTSLELPGSNVSFFDLWHKCLGHPCNKTVMSVLQKCNLASKVSRMN